MIIPVVPWAPVWPGFCSVFLGVLDSPWQHIKIQLQTHYVFFAERERIFKPAFPLKVVETRSIVSCAYSGTAL